MRVKLLPTFRNYFTKTDLVIMLREILLKRGARIFVNEIEGRRLLQDLFYDDPIEVYLGRHFSWKYPEYIRLYFGGKYE